MDLPVANRRAASRLTAWALPDQLDAAGWARRRLWL